MKITDLAAIVAVRNHITVVINDKGVSNKDDFKVLNSTRVKLDRKFVEALKSFDVDSLFLEQDSSISKIECCYRPEWLNKQLYLPFENDKKNPELEEVASLKKNKEIQKASVEDPDLREAISREKENLKKQGRSNRKAGSKNET